MFRDETETLTVRRKRQEASRSSSSSTLEVLETSNALAILDSQSLVQSPPAPALSISPCLSADVQATCFFFQNYVLEQGGPIRGAFQYLYELYGSEEIGSAVADSVASLGMVGLANFWKAPSIMIGARKKYTSAMSTVSSKLRDIEEAKTDQTLIAIMLLGLYEVNTCNSRHSMETWTKHISGATTLLQLRGKEQLNTPLRRHLFYYLRGQCITNCIQAHKPVPSIYSEWSQELLEYESLEQTAATSLADLAIKYCNLRASMSSFRDYSESDRIISTACAIEKGYADWGKTCPIQFIYQTVNLKERNEEVFSDNFHVYSNISIATYWNHYRCVRILLNELILDQLGNLYRNNPESTLLWTESSFEENQMLISNTTLLQLCQDICASVPYILGFDPDRDPKLPREIPKAIHGNLLIWPLYTAGVTDMVSDLMRKWVAERLQWISDVMGVHQAGPLASTLMARQDIDKWQGDKSLEDGDMMSYLEEVRRGEIRDHNQ